MDLTPFRPTYGSGQLVTAGAAQNVTLNGSDLTVVVINTDATEIAYVRITAEGDATAADMMIPPGNKPVCLWKGSGATRLSLYSSGTPDVYIVTGNGWLAN